MKKIGLGRGLDSLMRGAPLTVADDGDEKNNREVAVQKLTPGKFQPRRHFAADSLSRLADSIRKNGIIQPIVARPAKNGGLEIVAGERRWRAAKMAGLKTVPVITRKMSDKESLLCALVENLQRADLNPLEQAAGLHRLINELKLTHAQAGEQTGLSRPAVSNLLRLLELSSAAQTFLATGKIEMAHARALLPLPKKQQAVVAQKIAAQQWTVRTTEMAIKRMLTGDGKNGGDKTRKTADIRRLESDLSAGLSMRVEIQHQKTGGGKLTVHYGSLDSLERILKRLR